MNLLTIIPTPPRVVIMGPWGTIALGSQAFPGPVGPPGPQGPPGSGGDLHYTHAQTAAASVWTVNHNLAKRPAISVVDSAGTRVFGEENHISNNQTVLTFSAPFSGTAECN